MKYIAYVKNKTKNKLEKSKTCRKQKPHNWPYHSGQRTILHQSQRPFKQVLVLLIKENGQPNATKNAMETGIIKGKTNI